MSAIWRGGVVVGLLGAMTLSPAGLAAESPATPTEGAVKPTPGPLTEVRVERRAGGRKIYRITTGFVIEGRIQKPNAFYVLQRSQISYDWSALKKDFLPEILFAVTQPPF